MIRLEVGLNRILGPMIIHRLKAHREVVRVLAMIYLEILRDHQQKGLKEMKFNGQISQDLRSI